MAHVTRRTAVGLLAAGTVTPLVRAAAPSVKPAALAADIPLLQRIYETLHPGLCRYQTLDEWRARCIGLENDLSRSLPLEQQYLKLSRLLAQVRCGHTYANFFNQSKAVADVVIAPANKLPFHFVWLGDRMFVSTNPLSIDGLKRGHEIVAINGNAASAIQLALLPYMRADGSNDDKRRALLNVNGADRIETFDVFFPLLFPSDRSSFVLTVQDPARRTVATLNLAPIDQKQREAMMSGAVDQKSPDYWTIEHTASGVAVITMPGWALFDVKWDWKARIQLMFEGMAQRRTKSLIIDLRNNEGGLDCGNEIVSHLIDHELPVFAEYERWVRFRSTPVDLNPYLDTWDRSFEHLGEGAADLGNGFYRLKNSEDDVRRIAPTGPRFAGKVIVLCGPQNSSATFTFIDLMRRNRLAAIWGQATGGNQRGINGGSFFFVRLPHSDLEVDLPLVGTFPKSPKPDGGLLPDVRVDPTESDLVQGYDRTLNVAIAALS